jgi:glutathione reductase (NADPH)
LIDTNIFDLIVIGTGTAGSTVAAECRSKEWEVAIIDSLPFGGTCALRGCEPKKVLVEEAKTIDSNHKHENKGISDSRKIHIKWHDLIRFKRSFTDPFPKQREDSYIKAGIVPFHGHAKFIGQNTVKIEKDSSDNNNNSILTGKHILVSTGAKPANLGIPGSENVITSDQFLEFDSDHLPDNIVFIGGGYISFEFAHIAVRAGSKKVTIIHRGKQPLERFDSDLVNQLVQKSQDIGIDIMLQTTVKSIERSPTSYSANDTKLVVHASNNSGSTEDGKLIKTLKADMVVHGAGRVPNIEGLDLMKGGIEYTARGIKVNEYLQSISNPIIYAAGDVAEAVISGGLPLTPVASYDGNIAANNLLYGNTMKVNYNGLPSVVFTIPPLASVGLQENQAKEQAMQYKINHKNTSQWYSSRRVGETCSGFKVLVEEGSDKILGAHLLGPHADEVINIFSIAIRLGITTKNLNDPVLYSYPTNSSDVIYML